MVNGKAALVLGFALAAVIGIIFLEPVVGAVNDNTGQQSVTNESITADVGNWVELQGFDVVDGSETVYGFNDSSGSFEVATEGSDYEINNSDGALKALSGSSLIDDGEEVKVSYDYQATSGVTTTVAGFIPVMLGTLILFVVAQGVQREI